MREKRIAAAVLAAAVAVSMLAGCGDEKEPGKNTTEMTTQGADFVVGTEAVAVETQAEEPQYAQIISDGKVKEYNSVVTVDDSAYELYTYLDGVADNYAKSINKVAKELDGEADVYDLIIPLSSEITFPDNLRDKIESTDQHEAMQKIQAKMSDKVKTVDVYESLMEHREEYIYFRTDHHWTTLGAYYAYEDFCEVKGIESEDLDSYEKIEFDGFLGSFYNDTKDGKLKANPDTVVAYKPAADSILHVTASDGTKYDWPVIYDVTNYGASLKYSTFIASDNPYTVIKNKELTDGSSCIVVKESFGNAFIPFLVDHYETIYVIDYRYWTGSITEFAREKKVPDVIFLNNLSMIRNKSLVGKLHRVL